jgi:neutral ceramidase
MKLIFLLALTLLTMTAEAGKYRAGVAKRDISPKPKVDLLYTIMGQEKSFSSIHDPLFVKILALSDGDKHIAFVSLDLLYLNTQHHQEIQQLLGKQYDHVLVTVTHTHSGYYNEKKWPSLKNKILEAASSASKSMVSVEIGVAQGHVDEAYNRIIHKDGKAEMLWTNPQRQASREMDKTVGVIHLKTRDGSTLISLVNYPAHPVITMDLNNIVISADYPGYLAMAMASRLGGETIFFTGAAGDINPYDADTKPTSLALEKSKLVAEAIAEEVVNKIAAIKQYRTEGKFSFESHAFNDPIALVSTISLTEDVFLAGFPGEYFNDFALELKRNSPFDYTFFLGYCNGYIGYVPTVDAQKFGGYGAELDKLKVTQTTGLDHVNYAVEAAKRLYQRNAIRMK